LAAISSIVAATPAATGSMYASRIARLSMSGSVASSTWWPRSASSFAASVMAARTSACTLLPSIAPLYTPMRSAPGSAPTFSSSGLSRGGAAYGSPGMGPMMASNTAALSRTLRLSTPGCASPPHPSP
jgi:hypothetical protein